MPFGKGNTFGSPPSEPNNNKFGNSNPKQFPFQQKGIIDIPEVPKEPSFKMSDDHRRNLKKKEVHSVDKYIKGKKKVKLEEKVETIIKQEAVVINVRGIKDAEKDFSNAHTKIRTLIRQIPDASKARQLEKQLGRVMGQMLELFGSLYFKA